MKHILALILAISISISAQAVTIDLVSIGNPGNNGDINGGIFGQVATSYQIGVTEITNTQYVEFLNAKAATDPLGLYNQFMGPFSDGGFPDGGITRSGMDGNYTYTVKETVPAGLPDGSDYTYGDKPVNYVSWYDAIRFANWMNNGQGSGSTETGSYTLLGGTKVPSNADSITRNAGATWFLPTENEWYKAAYYDGAAVTYFDYPTGTDAPPDNNLPATDTGNSANFLSGSLTTTGDPGYPMTAAGSYLLTQSPYGTFDQGGNVAEWNKALVSAGKRGRRGGAWNTEISFLSSAVRDSLLATAENNSTGFRLARTAAAVGGVPGDYNANGIVDAADYAVWRDHLNTPFQLQNEVANTSPGTVDQDDYTAWRMRFGNTSGSGAGNSVEAAAVPEPTAAMLVILWGMMAASRARLRERCARDSVSLHVVLLFR